MPYRATVKTEARKAATRERIVAGALDRVATGGFAAAGIQQTAARAAVAVGTVYRYFPSKAELFAEVFRRASERELEVVVEVSAPDGRSSQERIAAAVEAFCRRALAAPTLAYALIAEPVDATARTQGEAAGLSLQKERLRLRRGYRDAFAAVLRDGVAAGELRPHDERIVAAALVGALGEALVGPLGEAGAGRTSHEALVATLVQLCLDALPTPTRSPERSLAR
ncbi:MAG TPA: TetR/AcrR family transcriptional regulator [Thermoleophilaceae bacterium]